jgi:hypothetical protein
VWPFFAPNPKRSLSLSYAWDQVSETRWARRVESLRHTTLQLPERNLHIGLSRSRVEREDFKIGHLRWTLDNVFFSFGRRCLQFDLGSERTLVFATTRRCSVEATASSSIWSPRGAPHQPPQIQHGKPQGDPPAVDAVRPNEIVRGTVVISQTHASVSQLEQNIIVSLQLAWNIENLRASTDDL